jgi:hypothetical protein
MGPMSAQLLLRCPTTVSVCGLPRWEGTWPQPGRYRHRFNSCLADSGPKAQWRCTRRRIRFGWCSGQHRACEDPLVSLNLAAGSSRLNLAQEGVASEVSGRPFESDLQGHRPGVVLEWPVPGFEYRGGFVSPWGSDPAPLAWRHPRPVRPSVGRLPLRQRMQVRVLHGSPTAGVAHPGPSCRPAGPRWTTHKESRHAVPRGA